MNGRLVSIGMSVGFGFVLLLASWFVLRGEYLVHGDGVEYVLQTQALALRGQIRIECEEVRNYWNRTNPYGITLDPPQAPKSVLTESAQAGGRWGGLYPDFRGDYRYYHFWAYSLAVAPVYFVMHYLVGSPAEYLAFRLCNWVFLLAPLIAAWNRRRSWGVLAVGVLILFSPWVPYTDWQHPELFCFSLVFFSFWLAASPRWYWWSPLLLGIAASQNIPMMLVFPLHLAYCIREQKRAVIQSHFIRVAVGYGIAVLIAVSSLLYSAWYFGCFNVIAELGLADLKYASMGRVCDFFFSPAVGVVWLYPTLFLFLPWILRRRDMGLILGAVLIVIGMTYLASATRNFNAGQVGSLRYAVWILAPLWYFLFSGKFPPQPGEWKGWGIPVLLILMACNFVVISKFKYDRLLRKDLRHMAVAQRGVPEVAALYAFLRYHDDVEILVETIAGKELSSKTQFNGVYIWTLGPKSSLCVVAEREAERASQVEWKAPVSFRYRTSPPGNEVIKFTNGMARLAIPPGTRYCTHPYLGNYFIIWLDTAVDRPEGLGKDHFRDTRHDT